MGIGWSGGAKEQLVDLFGKLEDLRAMEVGEKRFLQSVDCRLKNIYSGLISIMILIYNFIRLRSLIRDGGL